MPNVVTIFCDASFCNRTRAAGWAAWIKTHGSTTTRSGPMKRRPMDAGEAEVAAAANALTIATKMHGREAGTWYIVTSDCLLACHIINGIAGKGRKFKGWPYASVARDTLIHLVADLKAARVKVEARHVRGHAGGHEPRSWVNEQMDRLAKAAMKKQREEFKNAVQFSKAICAEDPGRDKAGDDQAAA